MLLGGCSGTTTPAGESETLPTGTGAEASADAASGASTGATTSTGTTGTPSTGAVTTTGTATAEMLPDLPAAETDTSPTEVDTLTVTLVLPTSAEPSANLSSIELCLSDDRCYPMRRPARDDSGKREAGPLQFDVHAFEGLGLDRDADVERFELRATGLTEAWSPRCISVHLDGEPVHCTREFAAPEDPENPSWSRAADEPGECVSCFERGEVLDLRVTHGPMVGARDSAAGEARIWARAYGSREVQLRLADNPTMEGASIVASEVPEARDDFSVELVATGLAASTTYYYQLLVDGELHDDGQPWSPGGVYRLPMPPSEGEAGVFTFALGSCARMFKHGNYDAVASLDPAFLLSVGDYHYGNVLEHHFVDNADEPYDKELVALNDMRWWYRSAQWERSHMLAMVPTVNTWDDHDYGGGQLYAEGKEHSRRAMLESFANPPRLTEPEDRATYFRFSHGDSEFFVVDARWHRPRLCSIEGGGVACQPELDPLGDAQRAWLLDGLTSSTATFKFVAAGTRWYGGGPKAWTPFLAHRDALLGAIETAGVEGVVFLAGGPHVSELRTFEAAGRTWHEVISSPLSSGKGSCSGAAVSCYDATKHFVALEVDTLLPDPEIRLSIVHAYDDEVLWDAPPIKLSAL